MSQTSPALSQDAESIEKIQQDLSQILSVVATLSDSVRAHQADLQSLHEELEEQTSQTADALSEIQEAISQSQVFVDEYASLTEDKFQLCADTIADQHEWATSAASLLSSTFEGWIDSASSLSASSDALQQALSLALAELLTEHTQATEHLSASSSLVEQSLKQLQDMVKAGEEQHTSAAQEAREHLASFYALLSEALPSQGAERLQSIFQVVETLSNEGITSGFTRAESDFSQSIQGFSQQFLDAAEALAVLVIEELHGAASYFLETLKQHLSEALSALVEKALAALIEEIAECFGVMSAGATTSATLAPMVPALVATKAVIATINNILDAIGLG